MTTIDYQERNVFTSTVKTEWIKGNGRAQLLLETVCFIDSEGKVWKAPKLSIVDGASIPRFFWRIIGSPFVGHYRRASVIHDVYCKTRSETSEDVHKMFYEAMLVDKVPKLKALVMYYAVKFGGSDW